MKVRGWYTILLIGWAFVCLIGFGMSGGKLAYDASGLDLASKISFYAGWAFMISPVLLLPFGLTKRSGGRCRRSHDL
jgi:membrane protease YdiL (CAAX protease family)